MTYFLNGFVYNLATSGTSLSPRKDVKQQEGPLCKPQIQKLLISPLHCVSADNNILFEDYCKIQSLPKEELLK